MSRQKPGSSTDTSIRAGELLDGKVEKAFRAAQELSDATRASNETLKGVQDARRALEGLVGGIPDRVADEVGDHITASVTQGLEKLDAAITVAIEKKTKRIFESFDELSNTLYGKNREDGKPSIPEMLEFMNLALGLKWPVFLAHVSAAVEVSKGCGERDYGCKLPVAYAVLARVPHDGKTIESHLHLCEKHIKDIRDKGVVLKTVKLSTQVCPWPHVNPGVTDEDFLENHPEEEEQ